MNMKFTLSTLLVIAFFFVSNTVSAQSNDKEITTMKTAESQSKSWSYTYEVDSAKLATKIQIEKEEGIKDYKYYNKFIKALEAKREYVMNNPEEKAIADETGWFEQIDGEIAKAKLEREKLIEKK